MKLPSGTELDDRVLSQIADIIALNMLSQENSYPDSCDWVVDDLENGFEGEAATLPPLDVVDRQNLLEAIRVPTIKYMEAMNLARSKLFNELLSNKQW